MRKILKSPTGLIGTVLLAIVFFVTVFGPWVAPYDPQAFDPINRLAGPSLQHWLGTDQYGRDLFSRMLNGAPSTVAFGLGATLLGVGVGSIIGVIAGVAGGRTDSIIMRILDGMLAMPELLFTLLIVTFLGGGTTQAMLAVAVTFTPGMARIARSSVLSVRTREYVLAAQARGESQSWIVGREVLPNALGPIIVEATIRVSFAIMIGATLGFLGLGAQPPSTEWGLMVAESRQFMFRNPWCVAVPGLAIAITAMGFNLFGDALRDAFDPKRSH
ncbi:ABC transporter permease [Allosediminivita pacifica]|uniref:Peptide/nickel transport system permease protein n=1 Tax=Allosediminivita pacifica TaxID=1267769 RepID=A0A2T6ANH0_9RHOB|nr:ABC transporter permease [Allosediminivita pacifica]PTX45364.1 peptide/nickel transport system permease protein [Allosediminivita pacifica]GGB20687.1 ABC transporter permease [Allosediminivita pacifica]